MIKEKFPYFFVLKNIFFTLSELFQIINNNMIYAYVAHLC